MEFLGCVFACVVSIESLYFVCGFTFLFTNALLATYVSTYFVLIRLFICFVCFVSVYVGFTYTLAVTCCLASCFRNYVFVVLLRVDII